MPCLLSADVELFILYFEKQFQKEKNVMSMFNLFRKSNSEDSVVEDRKKDLIPLKEELNFSKNGYLFCSEGFTTLNGEIYVYAKIENINVCTLMAKIYENNNILIIDLFTEQPYRRKGIASIVVSTFVETVKKISDSINIYVNAVSCDNSIPQEKLEEFYRKYGIINGKHKASDLAQENSIPEDKNS